MINPCLLQAPPKPVMEEVAYWANATWHNGEFWRGIVVALLGIFLPVFLTWLAGRRKDRREQRRRRAFLTEVLFQGLVRNLVALRRIRNVIRQHQTSPELRLHTGHFDTTVMSAVEAFEGHADEYGHLVNAHVSIDHLNRRLDQVSDIERLNHEVTAIRGAGAMALQPYIDQLLGTPKNEGNIAKVEKMIVQSLKFLAKGRPEEELRAVGFDELMHAQP